MYLTNRSENLNYYSTSYNIIQSMLTNFFFFYPILYIYIYNMNSGTLLFFPTRITSPRTLRFACTNAQRSKRNYSKRARRAVSCNETHYSDMTGLFHNETTAFLSQKNENQKNRNLPFSMYTRAYITSIIMFFRLFIKHRSRISSLSRSFPFLPRTQSTSVRNAWRISI